MDHHERQEKKRDAMRKLRDQRRRAGELRRRVVATSLVAFVLLWAVVFAQMATGNDPVLSSSSKTVAATTGHRAKTRAKARAAKAEAGASTDAEAAEIEAAEAEVAEVEAAEPESEVFVEESEPEAAVEEPAPVTTSQS
jgi:hypothetical protein